jgi:hypothetical protein
MGCAHYCAGVYFAFDIFAADVPLTAHCYFSRKKPASIKTRCAIKTNLIKYQEIMANWAFLHKKTAFYLTNAQLGFLLLISAHPVAYSHSPLIC